MSNSKGLPAVAIVVGHAPDHGVAHAERDGHRSALPIALRLDVERVMPHELAPQRHVEEAEPHRRVAARAGRVHAPVGEVVQVGHDARVHAAAARAGEALGRHRRPGPQAAARGRRARERTVALAAAAVDARDAQVHGVDARDEVVDDRVGRGVLQRRYGDASEALLVFSRPPLERRHVRAADRHLEGPREARLVGARLALDRRQVGPELLAPHRVDPARRERDEVLGLRLRCHVAARRHPVGVGGDRAVRLDDVRPELEQAHRRDRGEGISPPRFGANAPVLFAAHGGRSFTRRLGARHGHGFV